MGEQTGSMRQGMVWGAITFGVVLAVIVGVRLDQAALTAVVGVACGVGASIPTGLLVVWLLRRKDVAEEQRRARLARRELSQPPQVVVVAPPATPQLPQPASWPGAYGALAPAQRDFAVIGEEEIEYGVDDWRAQR